MKKIIENKAKCLYCKETVEPKTDNSIRCGCKRLIVGGGDKVLLRFKFNDRNDIVNAIENRDYLEKSVLK